MNSNQSDQIKLVVHERIDKVLLNKLATDLELELNTAASQSTEIAEFAKYEPVVSAIKRAKAMQIELAEELPGMRYWNFETDLAERRFSNLGEALAKFRTALRCWQEDQTSTPFEPP